MFTNIMNSLKGNIVGIIFVGILIITFFTLVFFGYQNLAIEKRIRDRKIKPRKSVKPSMEQENKNTWLNYFANKLDKEYLDLKLIHSGYPLGIRDTSKYILIKLLFTISGTIMGLELFDKNAVEKSIFIILITSIIGFFFVDFLIDQSKKSRVNKINNQLPVFLVYFDTYNKAGFLFEDTLSTVIDVLQGELKKEVIRFNVQYSMTKNFEESLKEFIRRLGTDEADSIEIKLRQCYFTGYYDDVVSDEKELIEKKILNDIANQTKKFELYLAISMGLLVFNMFLILIYPLSIMINSNLGTIS